MNFGPPTPHGEPSGYSEPPLTPPDAAILIDALLGYRAALCASSNVLLPALIDFVR
jgi:hypothetical protein